MLWLLCFVTYVSLILCVLFQCRSVLLSMLHLTGDNVGRSTYQIGITVCFSFFSFFFMTDIVKLAQYVKLRQRSVFVFVSCSFKLFFIV